MNSRKLSLVPVLLVVAITVVASAGGTAYGALDASQVSFAFGPDREATHAAAAYNATSNQYLIVWEEENAAPNGSTSMIYGRICLHNMSPVTVPFPISTPDTSDNNIGAGHPSVAWNAEGNVYLVVWEADHFARDDFEIFGQLVGPTGALLGDSIPISSTPDGAHHPDVAADNEGRFFVVWDADMDPNAASVDVWGAVVDTGGTIVVGQANRANMGNAASNRTAFAPAVAYNETDAQYMVCWTSDGGGNADNVFEIFGRTFDHNGAALLAPHRISDMSSAGADRDGFDADVVYGGGSGQYFIAWSGDGGPSAGAYEVYAEIEDAVGAPLFQDFRVSAAEDAGADRDAWHPALAYNDAENAYLNFYESDGGTLADEVYEVFVRRVQATGLVDVATVQVSMMSGAGADRDGRLPAAAFNSTNQEYAVAWNGDGQNQSDNDDEVFAHKSELDALPILFTAIDARVEAGAVAVSWAIYADEDIAGFRVYRAEGQNLEVNIVRGGMLAADAREYVDAGVRSGARYRYVVSAVRPDGSEVLSAPAAVQLQAVAFSLGQNFPNPFNPATTIRYSLPSSGHVSITVFDVTGARVALLVDEASPGGSFEAQWNGHNDRGLRVASGTYFYRMVALLDDGRRFTRVRKLVLTK